MEVKWSQRAINNLDNIQNFIALDNPARAFSFVDELVASVERLKDFPESGMITLKNPMFRQITFKGYRVIYYLRLKSLSIITILGHGQSHSK